MDVVLALVVTVLLFALAAWVVARASMRILRRLGLDPMAVLVALGLAEEPVEQRRKERRRLGEILRDERGTYSSRPNAAA